MMLDNTFIISDTAPSCWSLFRERHLFYIVLYLRSLQYYYQIIFYICTMGGLFELHAFTAQFYNYLFLLNNIIELKTLILFSVHL